MLDQQPEPKCMSVKFCLAFIFLPKIKCVGFPEPSRSSFWHVPLPKDIGVPPAQLPLAAEQVIEDPDPHFMDDAAGVLATKPQDETEKTPVMEGAELLLRHYRGNIQRFR